MKFSYLTAITAALAPIANAAASTNSTGKGPDKDGKYWIQSDELKLGFIALGGAVSNVYFKDKHGIQRDIIGGYDNASYYTTDKVHPHFGAIPGRYANRIKNSTFNIDGKDYHVAPNENPTKDHPKGVDTLHGGPDGWDYRNFTAVAHTDSSITFSFVDPDGKEGFPGEVVFHVTYTVEKADWHIKMVALSTTKKTPIMLSSHAYWNLDGWANDETDTVLNHTLHMPYSGQRVAVDNILIPTGDILANKNGSANDFWSKPKQIGASLDDPELVNNCGFNCTGYDNCYLVNREQIAPYDWRTSGPVVSLSSEWSGIKLDVHSDQVAFQIYSCNAPGLLLKKDQGNKKFGRTTAKYGCIVLEPEDYIDGINHPEWQRTNKQIFGPGDDPYVFQARYSFSHLKDEKSDSDSS